MPDQKETPNYLSLEEAADILSVSQDYLLALIRLGRIKGFKIAELWFTSQEWINELRGEIKRQIEVELAAYQEADSGRFTNKWVKVQTKRIRPDFSYLKKINYDQREGGQMVSGHFFAWSNLPVVLSLILFLSVLGYTALVPVVNSSRSATLAIDWTGKAIKGEARKLYRAIEIVSVGTAVLKTPVSDEAITRKWQEFWRQKVDKQSGRVAGEQAESGL
ncbi:MAG: helix-turn-helix domain-containing protein [Patescibacteria group bacterium]